VKGGPKRAERRQPASCRAGAARGFLAAAKTARERLAASRKERQAIAPLVQAGDSEVLEQLCPAYR
jgi:hypothetical protein